MGVRAAATDGLMSAPASFWEAVQIFNADECDELQAALSRIPSVKDVASDLQVVPIPPEPFRKLYERVWASMAEANARTWRYQLDGWLTLQLLTYETGAEYPFHTDLPDPRAPGRQNKLALSLLLSAPDTFQGGELEILTGVQLEKGAIRGPAFIAPLDRRGAGVLFPSFLVHQITRVTAGTRVVLVGRAGGPAFV